MICPICTSGADFLVSKKDALSQTYDYYKCRKCAFLFDKDFADTKKLQLKISKVYENNYFEDTDYGWKNRGDSYSKKINMLLGWYKALRRKKNMTVLDYGGGNGYITSKIDSKYITSYYDKYVKPTYSGGYKILNEPEKSDVVLAVEVAEHIIDISEWKALLDLASDMLIFTTETSDGMTNAELANSWYLRPEVGHVAIYSSTALNIIAKKYGFAYFFFPSKSFHIFIRSPFLSKFNLVTLEYPFYNLLRTVKKYVPTSSRESNKA
ncbi:MAG: class I SAM-dependent methyltransferase [Candidatus Staskawiczbacteria bacterium]|nr:class I SAM-dependent methyltransferase [Candidatus Staskawiczbacteria bacterium]